MNVFNCNLVCMLQYRKKKEDKGEKLVDYIWGGGGGLSAADGAGIRIYVVYASLF